MEALRRQIHEESTIISMLDRNLDNDQRELDSLNEAEALRAEEVSYNKYTETTKTIFDYL